MSTESERPLGLGLSEGLGPDAPTLVAWKRNATQWLRQLPATPLHAPYFSNGMFATDCRDLADLLEAEASGPNV